MGDRRLAEPALEACASRPIERYLSHRARATLNQNPSIAFAILRGFGNPFLPSSAMKYADT